MEGWDWYPPPPRDPLAPRMGVWASGLATFLFATSVQSFCLSWLAINKSFLTSLHHKLESRISFNMAICPLLWAHQEHFLVSPASPVTGNSEAHPCPPTLFLNLSQKFWENVEGESRFIPTRHVDCRPCCMHFECWETERVELRCSEVYCCRVGNLKRVGFG